MYLSRVLSHKNAWNDLNEKYPSLLKDIACAAQELTRENILSQSVRPNLLTDATGSISSMRLDVCWENSMLQAGWYLTDDNVTSEVGRPIRLRGLGFISGSVSIAFIRHRDTLNRWLFTLVPLASKRGLVELPIAAIMLKRVEATLLERKGVFGDLLFDRAGDELKALAPLANSDPFLLLGFDLEKPTGELDVEELPSDATESSPSILVNRSIEFPAEYHQAGLGILSYFGTVLREKCPEENAKVTIEQDGMTVRLIIHSENGNRETIEKVLHEYQMVVQGSLPPEEFFHSGLKVIELKSEIRIAHARLETQKDFIEHQRLEIGKLNELVVLALQRPTGPAPAINFQPVITLSSHHTTTFHLQETLQSANADVQDLTYFSRNNPEMEMRLRDLEEALKITERRVMPEEVRSSGGLAKLKKLIDEANEVGSSMNTFVSKISDGVAIVQKLARKYNNIAEWCGAPTVPRILVGTDE
jgi:hypothetical protein